jgi:hypothetical protein
LIAADCEGENIFEFLSDETNPPADLRQMRKDLMTNEKTKTGIVMGETSTLPLKLKVWRQPPQHDVDVAKSFDWCPSRSLYQFG